jgi:hypothetical protein
MVNWAGFAVFFSSVKVQRARLQPLTTFQTIAVCCSRSDLPEALVREDSLY